MRPVLRCGASSFYQEQRSIMNLGFLRHGWGCAGKQYLPSKLYSALCTERPPRSQDRLGGLSGFEANNRLPDDIVTVVEKRYKAHHQRKDFSQETLQPGPELFNGIELRGVRWKEQNSASCVLGSKKQPLFPLQSRFFAPEKAEAGWKTRIQKVCCPSFRYTETAREFCCPFERRQCRIAGTFDHEPAPIPAGPAVHTHIPDTGMYLYRFRLHRRPFPEVYP